MRLLCEYQEKQVALASAAFLLSKNIKCKTFKDDLWEVWVEDEDLYDTALNCIEGWVYSKDKETDLKEDKKPSAKNPRRTGRFEKLVESLVVKRPYSRGSVSVSNSIMLLIVVFSFLQTSHILSLTLLKESLFMKFQLFHNIVHFILPSFFSSFFAVYWYAVATLFIVGSQIERRVGSVRFLVILIVCICISNTFQYVVLKTTTPSLLALPVAVTFFALQRKQHAPWAGYNVPSWIKIVSVVFFIIGCSGSLFFLFGYEEYLLYPVFDRGLAITIAGVSGYVLGFISPLSSEKS